ncbi:hypothetical protein [Amycolatopsis sp. cmx-4-83]|uniref:hypothetical protein n=1 Tax=Amycolatopsis sp. cmx-4-83 TaxID=2790940 RepID=UPI00397DD10F
MFENAEMVLAALSAGAAAGATTSASRMVTDAYEGLKSATARAIKGWHNSTGAKAAADGDPSVEEKIADPESYHDELLDALEHVDPASERELFVAATMLQSLLNHENVGNSSDSPIIITGSQAIQTGQYAEMHVKINERRRK